MKASPISPPSGPVTVLLNGRHPKSHFPGNPSITGFPMKTRFIPLVGLACLALSALPTRAQISVVNTSSLNDTANTTSYTLSFDAGNGGSADKLMVSAGAEGDAALTGITYAGVALTFIPNTGNPATGRNRGIWYLDHPFSGGAADLVVSGDGVTNFSHMRLGVASISGSAPGAASRNFAAAGSVSLNVPVNDSFVFAAYAGNRSVPASTAETPLSEIFGVNDDSANAAAGYENLAPAGPVTYSFTNPNSPESSAAAFVPATAAPVIIATSPADDAPEAPVGTDLVATFSEPVVAGTGDIELWQAGGASPVESFTVTISPRLTFSGQTLTINPTANLTPGVEYFVLMPATAVVDTTGGDAFAGIPDPTVWSFTGDGTAPTLVSRFPADDATNARSAANLVATFSEPVLVGTGGAIELWQVGGGSPVESFDVATSSRLTLAGVTLTIDPTADLLPGTDYYVTIADTALQDGSGNAFAGLTGETDWNFTTRATAANITAVNTSGGLVQKNPLVRTWSFDAGATADMVIVAYSGEISTPVTGGSIKISYAGSPMIRALGGVNAAIFYLDLSTTSYTGGAADLVVDLSDYGVRNGLGIGAVSINSGDQPIELHTTASHAADPQSVTLNTTASNAFAVASFNSNNTSGTPVAVNAPLTQIYASTAIGSARGGAGYQAGVTPGTHVYTWTLPTNNPEPRAVVAASFVIAGTGGTAFDDWAGTGSLGPVTFDGDTNADGVRDGMAFLLGAANPDDDATGLLPSVSENGSGGLVLTFNCLPIADRGDAKLYVEHSGDLGVSDAWSATVDQVPDATDAVADNGVTFGVTPGSPTNRVVATIASSEAAGGKLFGRLHATEN